MTEINNRTISSHDGKVHAVGTVILFLSFAVLIACICKSILSQILKNKFPVPFTVIVLIFGFIIGFIIAHIDVMDNDFLLGEKELREINPHMIYYIFLPLLIFDSSFNSQYYVIQPQILSAILLAGPGVLISISIVAVVAVYIFPYNWSWLVALMFGSILSATDPVAVVALLHVSGASISLASLIDLESLLNDGSAFVIFMILRDIIIGRCDSAQKVVIDTVKFTIGGSAFGFACGILAVIVLNRINNELEVEIISTFGLAYLIFYVADVELGVSAVLALVVMGLFMAKHKYCISSRVQIPMVNTWRIIIDFANILIFMITGIILAQSLVGTKATIVALDFGFSIVLYIALHVGRLLSVLIVSPLIHWSGVHLSWKEYTILTWSGLRGRRLLYFEKHVPFLGTPESETVLLQALIHMRKLTLNQLHKMKKEKQFSDVDWNLLNEYLPEKLVQKMDSERKTNVYRRFSITSDSFCSPSSTSCPTTTITDIEPKEIPNIHEMDYVPINVMLNQQDISHQDVVLSMIDFRPDDKEKNDNFRNELTIRFLTALSVDYEKQWYIGMIRRRTLYILIKSVEKAKHQHSLKLHWRLIVKSFRLSKWLLNLMRFDYIDWITKQFNKLLFDHIFLTIELILAFYSARTRMDNLRMQFPELASIDERIWHEVFQETHLYHVTAISMLLDLKQSYEICWRIHMTKRSAQMLLKYESKTITEIYETGMLGEKEYSYILGLIENKLFDLEFYRVRMPKGHVKAIENAFDLLLLFKSLPNNEKARWQMIMKAKHKWFQPGTILLRKGQRVFNAYLIARGIVQCKVDTMPIHYRSGNIVGIDALFSQNCVAHATYSVCGGLVEAYRIDATLLNQLLNDENLAPSIYREIALHVLSNHYQPRLKLNRLQLKLLLHKRAKFYWNQPEESIYFQENQQLFILSGNVMYLSNGQNSTYDAIQLQTFDKEAEVLFNRSTVAFSWTDDDEVFFAKDTNLAIDFSIQTLGLISNDLFYSVCSDGITESSEQRC
ncbi:unnamed protein product [Rotaria sp. Silwood2]|nr:unnamed protein product [Rotaria sp. Silwood2]